MDSACLNPCFDGIWSLTHFRDGHIPQGGGLNPCFDGIWSLTIIKENQIAYEQTVLILVLMEYGL